MLECTTSNIFFQVRFSVNLSLGAAEGDKGSISSSMAVMGGLVARGEETATGCPNAELPTGRLNPASIGEMAAAGGGGLAIVPEPEGVAAAELGTGPLLNSAQRGHLRFVSKITILSDERDGVKD